MQFFCGSGTSESVVGGGMAYFSITLIKHCSPNLCNMAAVFCGGTNEGGDGGGGGGVVL